MSGMEKGFSLPGTNFLCLNKTNQPPICFLFHIKGKGQKKTKSARKPVVYGRTFEGTWRSEIECGSVSDVAVSVGYWYKEQTNEVYEGVSPDDDTNRRESQPGYTQETGDR